MTLSCDTRIASETTQLQLPFTRLGICTDLSSSYLLPRLIGMGKASELLLTSRMIDAKEVSARQMHADLSSQPHYEFLATAYLSDTEDHKEAAKAFREKRNPFINL